MTQQQNARAVLTADGSFTAHSSQYGQTYHSIHGAVTESRHVFLQGARVASRLAKGESLRVLEVGLGLGLNAMVTAAAAHQAASEDNRCQVHYVGIEHAHPDPPLLRTVLQQYPQAWVDSMLAAMATPTGDALETARINDQFSLAVLPVALEKALCTLHTSRAAKFDAIYLDAFSPDSNPECWQPDILYSLGQLLNHNGILTTYCAKGSVRRALQAAELRVNRFPGPPGKRECLAACR